MPAIRSFFYGLLIGLLWLIGTDATAQQPVFQTQLESDEVVEGSRFEISFILQNATGRAFKAPDIRPFRVVSGPNEMTGMGFVNGKSYKHQSWTYVLEAGKPGLYAIGAARVNAQGEVLRTQPLQIRVKPATTGRGAGRGAPDREDALFIQGEFSAKEAFVGQQVIYRIVLYTRLTVSNPELLSMPETDKAYTHELRRFDTRTQYEQIRGQQYAVRTLYEMAVFPQEAGRLEITPAQMRVGVEQAGTVGALFGPKPVLLQTQAVALEVKSLPMPEPAAFCGGVGQYEWKVGADRKQLSTDDAVTVSVSVKGNGDARRFSAPVLEAPQGLEVYDPKIREEEEYENGEELVHTRTYDFIVLPQKAGQFPISASMIYFDPDSNRYIQKKMEAPITLLVEQGKSRPQDPSADQSGNGGGVHQPPALFTRLRQWLREGWWWLLLLPLAAAGAWWALRYYRRPAPAGTQKTSVHVPSGRTDESASPALPPLPPMADEKDARAFYDHLYHVLQAQLGARYALPLVHWSESALIAQMRRQGASESDIEAVREVLHTCEQALFAGQDRSGQMPVIREKAARVLKQ